MLTETRSEDRLVNDALKVLQDRSYNDCWLNNDESSLSPSDRVLCRAISKALGDISRLGDEMAALERKSVEIQSGISSARDELRAAVELISK